MKTLYRLLPVVRRVYTSQPSAAWTSLTSSTHHHGNRRLPSLGVHGNYTRCYHGSKASAVQSDNYLVDMRSDVLTKPTDGMKQAMINATWGDDVFAEESTVIELERQMAAMFGMEAALFVPSGTMGNLICVLSHCNSRGLEVLLGDKSHLVLWEQGGMAQLGGVHPRTMPNLSDGTFNLDFLEDYIRPKDDPHQPWTALIAVENTHNYCGGRPLAQEFMHQLRVQAQSYEVPIHLDGARVMNAAVAHGVPVKDITQYVDSVSFCFSKGVGTPVGSIIGGTAEFIARGLRLRKVLGGGWRKPGPLAAACLYALKDAEERMAQDHKHATMIRQAVVDYGGNAFTAILTGLHSDMVFIDILKPGVDAEDFCTRLQQVTDAEYATLGEKIVVKGGASNKYLVRLCTYTGVTLEDVEKVIAKVKYVGEEMTEEMPKD